MAANTSSEALSFLFGGAGAAAVGTWFFVEGDLLPVRLRGKTRVVVASKESADGGVVVYPRSASRQIGESHTPHSGHVCKTTALHEDLRQRYNEHPCHIDKNGWVDADTPITLTLAVLEGHRMCFEEEGSALLTWLEQGRA